MKARNVWLVTLLVASVAMSLELLVYGGKETLLRFESFIVLALIYFPFLSLAFVFGLPLCGFLGVWIAARKLRSSAEGFFLGFLLGPVGVIIEPAFCPMSGRMAGKGEPPARTDQESLLPG